MWKDLSLSTQFSPPDKCVAGEGHERRQVFDEEQDRAVWSSCRLVFFFFLSSPGLKINPSFPSSIHTSTCLLLQRSVLTVITSHLLYVIAPSSHHLQPLTLTIGGGNEVKV